MVKYNPKKEDLKAGLSYLDDVIRTAYGTHDRSVSAFTKYTKADSVKHARQGISKLGVQSGAKQGGKRTVSIITEAAEDYIRDRTTGKPTSTSGSFIHLDDAKKAVLAQVDEAMNFAKNLGTAKYAQGVSTGKLIGHVTGAQKGKLAGQAMAGIAFKTGIKAGAKAMFGPAAIAGGAVMHYAGKGKDRAQTNPGFHKGKAGKSYLDLSTNTSGKYGIDY